MAFEYKPQIRQAKVLWVIIRSLCMAPTWELPTSNMLLRVLDMFGREYESHGDSTGKVYEK
ncbi:MAG: hypothetical protein HOH14_03165 [Gammaproteobacteria bacterium]|jgi:hypothetical protein|nr:hypothetical protein [Gammaproteobacteria bacterium]MBT6042476.1 hypothetical protein [Gammaproteobacteria bacterium]